MFEVLFSDGLLAIGASFIVTVIFMALSFYRYVPTVYLVMDIMPTPAMGELGLRSDPMFVVKPLIYNIVAMVAMIFATIQLFKRKDLLDERSHLI